jgi:hypothetical protein
MNSKIKLGLISFVVLALIAVAGWLSIGLGGKLLGNYKSLENIKTTQGLASDTSDYDPHITKVSGEYQNFLGIVKSSGDIEGIYEKVSAGDYSYETLDDKSLGRYTVESKAFIKNEDVANKVYQEAVRTFQEIGYTTETKGNNEMSFTREFQPAKEASDAQPGVDTLVIALTEKESSYEVSFNYQSTELPLSGIPSQGQPDYTVEEVNKMVSEVDDGTLDACDFEPNGAVGGWYPEYSCLKELI